MSIDSIDQIETLSVSMHCLSERMLQVLTFFFQQKYGLRFRVKTSLNSDILIIDIDSALGMRTLEELISSEAANNCILLSLNQARLDNYTQKNTIKISKPFRHEQLVSALEQAREKLLNPEAKQQVKQSAGQLKPPSSPPVLTQSITPTVEKLVRDSLLKASRKVEEAETHTHNEIQPETEASPAKAEKLIDAHVQKAKSNAAQAAKKMGRLDNNALVGSGKDLSSNNKDTQDERIRYKPEDYLQGTIEMAIQKSELDNSVITIALRDGNIWVCLASDTISTNISLTSLRSLCLIPLSKKIALFRDNKQNIKTHRCQNNESVAMFLWRITVWTARGRVSSNINLEQTIQLRYWPNLTRYLPLPHSTKIAALWANHKTSLLQSAETLQIAQRYVFSFYSANHALGLIVCDDKQLLAADEKKTQLNSKPIRSILGKLIKRLQNPNDRTH